MTDERQARPEKAFPLWGTALGAAAGVYFGDVLIGALIGAGLGVGIGFTLFAAAIVVASGKI